jgi:hypothetical protein
MADITADKLLGALGLARKDAPSDVVAPVVGALLVGGFIGAGLALLFAPKSGQALREDLKSRLDEATEDLGFASKSEAISNPSNTVGFNRPL